jgi:Uma2 family endonuclease
VRGAGAAYNDDSEETRMAAETQPASTLRQPPAGRITYEEFLDWCDEDTLAEWVDGEVIVTSPASLAHQDLADFLTALLRIIVQRSRLGRVVSAPFQMRLVTVARGREPGVLFVATGHLDRLHHTYLDGPADLVIEVTSPESFARDRGDKFIEYEQAAVPEYWLLDPDRRQAEFYQLDAAGRYRLVPADAKGTYQSRAIPLRLRVDWLWQEPLPDVLDVLREVGLP